MTDRYESAKRLYADLGIDMLHFASPLCHFSTVF